VYGIRPAGAWLCAGAERRWLDPCSKTVIVGQTEGPLWQKNEMRLSRAAMETLAIIAYSQPITRAEIEAIRGVNVDAMIRLLMAKNLITDVGKRDAPGKPMQYGTTKEF